MIIFYNIKQLKIYIYSNGSVFWSKSLKTCREWPPERAASCPNTSRAQTLFDDMKTVNQEFKCDTLEDDSPSDSTFKQVVTAILQHTLDVEGYEELGSQRVSVQMRGQSERKLQHWNQQKATRGCFPVPPLDLTEIRLITVIEDHTMYPTDPTSVSEIHC